MAQVGQRRDIESKVILIAERVVRGKYAEENKEVRFYKVNKYVALIATALTSIGVGHPLLSAFGTKGESPTIQQVVSSFTGFPLVFLILGVAVFVTFYVLRRIYEAENIEKKAIESLALHESFTRLEVDFHRELENAEPLTQLEPIRQAAHVLERNAALIIPERSKCRQAIGAYATALIAEKCDHWNDAIPQTERRE